MTNWLKRIFFPPPDPSLAAFEVAVNYAFAETGKCMNIEDELDHVKDELAQAIRDCDQAQTGWLTCRVCGAREEVHTCDYCHAARCRERDEARAELAEADERVRHWIGVVLQRASERDEAREALREIFYLYDADFEFYAKRWPWLINTSCGHPCGSAHCEECLPWEEKRC